MIIYIVLILASGSIGAFLMFYVSKKQNNKSQRIIVEQAKIKAKVIENEARDLLKEEQEDIQTIKILKENFILQQAQYKTKQNELLKILENSSGLTQEEAREIMLKVIKDDSKEITASIFRKEYKKAQRDMKVEVNNILSHAVTRYAGEFAAERLTNNIVFDNEETKGKIIGKDGRNIKSLEMITGVDIIIGEIPNTIIVSSFNLYRRAIATKTLNTLIADGRIHPAKIEEVYNSVSSEFENKILKEGEETVASLGIKSMNKELMQLIGRLRYRASYGQNALAHTLEVANLSGLIASQLGGDTILARRAGLLHDIGKALTHEMKGSHVDLGADVCKRYNEPKEVINAIYAHHGYEEANSIESASVCAADALSAARPGARREVLQGFLKRVEEIESISMSKDGVLKAYAINAGREIRVIVNATLVNDDEAVLLASQLAQDIEDKVQYPGEIKVHVIRETRAVGYAR